MRWMLSVDRANLPPPSGPFPEPNTDEQVAFYVRFGMAFAAWQFVESSLVVIFARAIKTANWDAAAVAFHVPHGFKVRLDMTNDAMQRSTLPPEWIAKWDKLYARLLAKSKRRNDLTHGVVMFQPTRKMKDRLYVAPNVFNPANAGSTIEAGSIITLPELDTMLHTFEKLNQDLTEFWQQAPWEISGPQPASPQRSSPRRWWANALSGRFLSRSD